MQPRLSAWAVELLRVGRFGLVGVTSALVYALVLLALVHGFALRSWTASAAAYLVAIPVSFLGQKYFTFQSKGRVQAELPAFILLQVVNLLAAVAITYLVVDVLGLSHYAGIGAVVATIAALSYAVMALGIFRRS